MSSFKNERFLWRVYCTTGQNYEFVISDTEPTECPSDSSAIDSNLTTIMNSVFEDLFSDGYVNIESLLADNQAIRIKNGDSNGGIDIDAGFGGIAIDSDNAISLDGSAYSNFSTTSGNLDLEATSSGTGATGVGGLLNLDADSGINIGCEATTNSNVTSIINLGTSSEEKNITIGNQTAGTEVTINGGTGGVDVNTTGKMSITSTNTDANALRFNTSGGLDVDTTGVMNFASGSSAGGAITLDAAFNNGGITISSGSQGVAINSNGGLIGIGHWSGGNMSIGTAAVARTITIGNTTSTTSVAMNSGTGGITIGKNTNAGDIEIGNAAAEKMIAIGNQTSGTELILNGGTGGIDIDTTGSFNVNSTSDASDALRFNTSGGLDVDTTGTINLATGSSVGGAITLDAAFNNGGITISSGSQGIAINSNGGLIGIGHWSGGNMSVGTAAVARTITIGNITSTTSIVINAGTGGITIGNNANGGEIQIGNVANAKTITVGNSTGASRIFSRYGTGGLIKTQISDTVYSDADQTATISQLLTGILRMEPSVTRTITLPSAADVVGGISGAQVNDSFDFSVINEVAVAINIAGGTGATLVGNMTVAASDTSGLFRLRLTNVMASSETYTNYRIA